MSGVTATIGGTTVPVLYGTLRPTSRIEERDRCQFSVRDDAGTMVFSKGQQVVVSDPVQGTIFAGKLNSDNKTLVSGTTTIFHALDCVDYQQGADNRVSRLQYTTDQYAGVVLADHAAKYLAAEGITAAVAMERLTSQADFATGTLSGVVASSNVGDGDLELAPAGTDANATLFSSNPSYNALKLSATAAGGYTNAYCYVKIAAPNIAVASGDTLTYTMWIPSTSPSIMAGVDLIFSDNTYMRDANTSVVSTDNEDLASHPKTDLKGYADDQWYTRTFTFQTSKTISAVLVAFEGDNAGAYQAYFRNIIINVAGTAVAIFNDNSTVPQINQLVSNSGYSNILLTVATVDDEVSQVVSSFDLTPVVLVKSSALSWVDSTVSNISMLVETSIDGDVTWQKATNGGAIPNLQPGMKPGTRALSVRQTITNSGSNPEALVPFGSVKGQVLSAPSASKNDIITTYNLLSNVVGATYTNTQTGLSLKGYTQSFDGSNIASSGPGYTLFGAGSPAQRIHARTYQLQSNTGADARARIDPAGTFADFTAEYDVYINSSSSVQQGFLYRTTAWQNNNDTYAYVVNLTAAFLQFGRGTNNASGTGTFTQIQLVSLSLSTQTWHHIRIEVAGTTHKIYLDGVLLINTTDTTYTAAGNVGFRLNNTSGSTQVSYFDNFGIVASLTGTWTTPSISLSAATTYGNSMIEWDASNTPAGTTVLVEFSTNGGGNWHALANGGAISSLSNGSPLGSVSLLVRITLTAQNANVLPIVQGLTIWVLGQYSASGIRTGTALSLAPAGRAGATLIAWNANKPTNTNVVVETTLDNGATWQSATNGGQISGITTASQTIDSFLTNTSANYLSFTFGGGTVATWTYDTANSRLVATSGINAAYQRNDLSAVSDSAVYADMDYSDGAGLMLNAHAGTGGATDLYYLVIGDNSALNGPGTMKLFRRVGGVLTQIGTASINFLRNTPHRFELSKVGSLITAYMDGVQLISYTDASPVAAGRAGLFQVNGGTAQFYNLRIQILGDDMTGKSAQTRVTLSTTDPSVTPQLLDISSAVFGPQIGIGALLPAPDYRYQYVSDVIKDLAKKSNYISNIKSDSSLFFQARTTTPAPFPLYSKDLLFSGLEEDQSADLYRNEMILIGVVDTIVFSETKIGDGSATSWALSYKLASAPTIKLNGVVQTVGQKGIDTGKAFYYEIGSETITQDSSGTKLTIFDTLQILNASGTYEHDLTLDNTGGFPGTTSQSQYQAQAGGSGIVSVVEDVSGQNLNTSAATTLGNSRLQEYGVIGRTLKFRTLHAGLAVGQAISAFVPEFSIQDVDMLITEMGVDVTGGDTTQQLWWTGVAVSGPNLGSWAQIFAQ